MKDDRDRRTLEIPFGEAPLDPQKLMMAAPPRKEGPIDWYYCTKCGKRFHWLSEEIFGCDGLWHKLKPWPEYQHPDGHCGPLEAER